MSNVQGYLDAAKANVGLYTTPATNALNAATGAINGITQQVTSYGGPQGLPNLPNAAAPPALPSFPNIVLGAYSQPTQPAVVQPVTIPTPNLSGAPTLSASYLGYSAPTPVGALAPFTGVVPTINTSFTFPTAPSLILPTAPTPSTIVIPSSPTVAVPVLSAVLPSDNLVAPANLDLQMANQTSGASTSFISAITGYVSSMIADKFPNYYTQMGQIQTTLSAYFAGGTGLNPAVENAIYERSKAKNSAEALRVRDGMLADAATRGFTMPGGALLSGLQKARQSGADNNADASAAIVQLQAEMEQKNLQFAVTTAANLQQTAINAMIAYMQNLATINEQAVEYAQKVVSALIEVYNAQVRMFEMRVQAYQAQVGYYEAQLHGAMMGVEVYKAQIEAARALVEVDHVAVEVFTARVQALSAQEALYRDQVMAVQAQAELEKLKLELFQSQVQTFQSQVQAQVAQYQGYSAQLEGENTKARVYQTQVTAYGEQVQAFKALAETQMIAVNAAAEQNKAVTMLNETNLGLYRAFVEEQAQLLHAQVAVGETQVQAYEAQVKGTVAAAGVATEYYKALAATQLSAGQLTVNTSIEQAKVNIAQGEAIARVATANATIYGNLAGAAMAGMNTLAAETITS